MLQYIVLQLFNASIGKSDIHYIASAFMQRKFLSALARVPLSRMQSHNGKDSSVTPAEYKGNTEKVEVTQKILDVVKEKVSDAQVQATILIQQQWKEEFNVPAGFIVGCLIVWYWIAWTLRSVHRRCAAMEAAAEKESREAVQLVQNISSQWKSDMLKASTEMKLIIAKNSELTGDIDRLTTALRNCKVALK